jgi:hypothetical protein
MADPREVATKADDRAKSAKFEARSEPVINRSRRAADRALLAYLTALAESIADELAA